KVDDIYIRQTASCRLIASASSTREGGCRAQARQGIHRQTREIINLAPLRQRHKQRFPIGDAQSRAGIPPGTRLVAKGAPARNIVSRGDLPQKSRVRVEKGQKE